MEQRRRRDLLVGKAYCRHAAERIRHRLATLFDNRDEDTLAVADAMLGLGEEKNG